MRAVLVGVLVLAMGSGGVMAQSAGSLIGAEVRAGDRITVVTTSGARFSGRLVEDAAGAITLRSNGEEQRVTHADVQRVDRRRNRFLLGPLIGLAAGLAVGLPLKKRFDNEGSNGGALLGLSVGLGVGMGSVVDLFNGSTRTVYTRPRP